MLGVLATSACVVLDCSWCLGRLVKVCLHADGSPRRPHKLHRWDNLIAAGWNGGGLVYTKAPVSREKFRAGLLWGLTVSGKPGQRDHSRNWLLSQR